MKKCEQCGMDYTDPDCGDYLCFGCAGIYGFGEAETETVKMIRGSA